MSTETILNPIRTFIFTLLPLHRLHVCFHTFISLFNKKLHQVGGCSNGRCEMTHLALKMGPTDPFLCSCSLWRRSTSLAVLPCCDCLGEDGKRGSPMCSGTHSCECRSHILVEPKLTQSIIDQSGPSVLQ